ncbi:MAG: seryl-tRNA synthetase [Myxococcota bacterium]|jgi:seryl-tRNA synthetase
MCELHDNDPFAGFRDALIEAGLLIPAGVRGVYGRSGTFEDIVERFERLVTAAGADIETSVIRFPPVFSRAHYSRLSHIHNFPDLMGSVHAFTGGAREHRALVSSFEDREDTPPDSPDHWSRQLTPSDVMLIPAACYPLYPTMTGTLPAEGHVVDLRAFVFRHEPSDDPSRMQSFRQREYVCLGTAEQALAHRDRWLARSGALLRSLGLPIEAVVANDPFFGRGGRLARATQREQTLKYELVVPICSEEEPTAVSSSNYHLDYFGLAFDILDAEGLPAHTSCVGFGLERIALALLKTHGLDPTQWPASVQALLGMD